MPSKVVGSRLGSLSLRTQLVLLTSMLIALAISVASMVALSTMRSQMSDQLDNEMRTNASTVYSFLVNDTALPSNGPLVKFQAFLLDADGNVLNSVMSTTTEDSSPIVQGWTSEQVAKNKERGISVPSVKGTSQWRIMAFNSGDSPYSMIIASPLDATNRSVASAGLLTIVFGLATLFASIAMTWVIVTRAFEPLARVEQTAARIAAGDLSQRIENYNPHTELGHLSTSLNTMLSRIEEAFEAQKHSEVKMRRFVGDASHELRTPLVTIRGYSELYRHGALQTDEAIASAMSRIESESKRMGQLVEDLLTLARIDERRALENKRVDLLQIAIDASNDAFATSPDREVDVVGLGEGVDPVSAPVFGDESRLRQVVANLMTNAIRYTPEGSPLEIAVGSAGVAGGLSYAVLEVRDHGPGIHGEDRERVFERFYRADTSRTRETGGTGLGLAIVAGIVHQHEGFVSIAETAGGGATFRIEIPQMSE